MPRALLSDEKAWKLSSSERKKLQESQSYRFYTLVQTGGTKGKPVVTKVEFKDSRNIGGAQVTWTKQAKSESGAKDIRYHYNLRVAGDARVLKKLFGGRPDKHYFNAENYRTSEHYAEELAHYKEKMAKRREAGVTHITEASIKTSNGLSIFDFQAIAGRHKTKDGTMRNNIISIAASGKKGTRSKVRGTYGKKVTIAMNNEDPVIIVSPPESRNKRYSRDLKVTTGSLSKMDHSEYHIDKTRSLAIRKDVEDPNSVLMTLYRKINDKYENAQLAVLAFANEFDVVKKIKKSKKKAAKKAKKASKKSVRKGKRVVVEESSEEEEEEEEESEESEEAMPEGESSGSSESEDVHIDAECDDGDGVDIVNGDETSV